MDEEKASKKSDRMPRGAVATVLVGVIATLGVIAIDIRGGSGTAAEVQWDTIEVVETPGAEKLGGKGSFKLARTSIAAIAPIASGQLLFRIAGVVLIDSGGKPIPTGARCDVTSPAEDSRIALTPGLRAAWPRPSIELQAQEVPEASVAMFKARGADALFLPIRDVFARFTDSLAPTDVDWDGFEEQTQNWVWTMPEGTGPGTATLGYSVIFKTEERPVAQIRCSGFVGDDDTVVEVEATQEEWPLEPPEPETEDAEAEADTATE